MYRFSSREHRLYSSVSDVSLVDEVELSRSLVEALSACLCFNNGSKELRTHFEKRFFVACVCDSYRHKE